MYEHQINIPLVSQFQFDNQHKNHNLAKTMKIKVFKNFKLNFLVFRITWR